MNAVADVLPGSPRARDIVEEGLRGAVAQRAASVTAALVLAIVCFVVLVTTGQSAASEQRVLARVDSVGSRLVTVVDDSGTAGIHPEGVARLEQMSDVEWAIGLGPARDVLRTDVFADSSGVAARTFVGELPAPLRIVSGRAPRPGEAVVGRVAARTLGGVTASASVAPSELLTTGQLVEHDARMIPVVGVFEAEVPLDPLDEVVLVAAEPHEVVPVRFLHVLARDVAVVERLAQVLTTSLEADDPTATTVDVPRGVLELRSVIAGDLGRAGRSTMLVVLLVSMAIVAVTTLGSVTARRREFGRRRALGATRSAIVALVLVQAGASAVVGVVAGTCAGLVTLHLALGELPGAGFSAGVAGLVLLVALLGSVPPAVAAALRDPMRILRVP